YRDGRKPDFYIAEVRDEVQKWVQAWNASPEGRARLEAESDGSTVRITDTRAVALEKERVWKDLSAQILLACDSAQSVSSLCRALPYPHDSTSVREAVEQLRAHRLMLEQEGQYLTLPVFRQRPARVTPQPRYENRRLFETAAA